MNGVLPVGLFTFIDKIILIHIYIFLNIVIGYSTPLEDVVYHPLENIVVVCSLG